MNQDLPASPLAFFEELAETNRAILSAREEGDWEKVGELVASRQIRIEQYSTGNFPPPSSEDRQKIRSICEQIRRSEEDIINDAREWQEQIRKFILN
jgi:hypothetical protein